jgi:hypothetical protein
VSPGPVTTRIDGNKRRRKWCVGSFFLFLEESKSQSSDEILTLWEIEEEFPLKRKKIIVKNK